MQAHGMNIHYIEQVNFWGLVLFLSLSLTLSLFLSFSLFLSLSFLPAIDGDGMVVALTFIRGRVHLRSRFVATRHRMEEQDKQKFLYRGQMGTHPNSPLKDTALYLKSLVTFNSLRPRYRNPSNTNAFYWGGKVFQ